MLVCIPKVLDASQLISVRERLDHANEGWVDGRVTAGYQGAPVKHNQQIEERSAVAHACQQIIVSALERHPMFISAVLPNTIYPPMFNRYGEGMKFGAHVDGSLRLHPRDGRKVRTDVSATACFFWVQSLIRDDNRRTLLYQMDTAIQRLNQTDADEVARRTLIGCYHNLIREWSDT
jgi:PKHD-type hydroxylase